MAQSVEAERLFRIAQLELVAGAILTPEQSSSCAAAF